ncbi:rhamnan synthesis F family protein [Tabrizicola aquatica]|uniref:rhamnan synthesis F family protein n=1 Tax=Tabrizicola aquatica TaxID=909926 RepID=UPI000CD0B968|nr:rhamnan synthesis F family protein [Tabrizicola aquatica]
MSLPPWWKIKRELARVRDAATRALGRALVEPPRQWLYDRATDRNERVTPGRLPLTGRVAVLVLFQPRGIAASVQLTLDHLAAEGWSVLAVSNAPLSDADRALVQEKAALVLERPNVGYDFGAYRAGVRRLDRLGHRPERLILMNDSTWFPLREGDDTLRRMEAMGVGMVGHIFKTEGTADRDHVESHLLMFDAKALAHPALTGFWRDYLMSDDRVLTIRHGEKGLTRAVRAAGLEVRGLIGRDSLITHLRVLDDAELLAVLREVVHHRADAKTLCEGIAAAAAAGLDWREDFLAWVDRALANSLQHMVSTTFIAPAMQVCGMGFVKKTSDRRFHLARQKVLELDAAGRIAPLHPAVRAEITASVAGWKPSAAEARMAAA